MTATPEEKTSDEQIVELACDLLENFGKVQAERAQLKIKVDKAVQEATAPFVEQDSELAALEKNLKASMAKLWDDHSEVLTDGKGKTAKLRTGTISERLAAASVEIPDPKAALRYLRRMRVLGRFTKVPERVIVKDNLKADPAFVNAAPGHIMWFQRKRSLHFKPVSTQLEAKLDRSPQRVVVSIEKKA